MNEWYTEYEGNTIRIENRWSSERLFINDKLHDEGIGLSSRSKLEIQNLNFKTNKILNEAGVLFSITTDHPVSMIQHLPLCAGLAVKHGLPMEAGLKAITINPARICRVEDRVGSLKVGKDADIAIFSGNPMEIFTKTLYTIIDGKIVYEYKEESCG